MIKHSQLNEVPDGYKRTDVGVIPEDWGVAMLIDVTLDMLQGINTAIDKPEYVYSGVPILKANNVIDQVVSLNNADQISHKSYLRYNQRYCVKRNDFLFSNIGARLGTGALWEHDIAATFAWNVMRIVPDSREIYPRFLAQLINSPKQSEKIQGEQSGSGMGFIPKATMQRVLIPLPPPKEQTAIANALSDVDALISELEKLIAKKQAIKTAAMQRLLTGKTRVQWRMENGELKVIPPDLSDFSTDNSQLTKQSELGEIPVDWALHRLDEVCLVIDGDRGSNYPNGSDFIESGYCVFLSATNVTKSGFRFDDVIFITKEKDGLLRKGKLLKGDIVLTTRGSIGNFAYFDDSVPFTNLRINSGMVLVRCTTLALDAKYLFDVLRSSIVKQQLETMSFGSAQPQLTVRDISDFYVYFPTNKEEQTAIATILSDMDKEIQALEQRLSKTRQIKQGMMQELLTGRTRLVSGELKMESGK